MSKFFHSKKILCTLLLIVALCCVLSACQEETPAPPAPTVVLVTFNSNYEGGQTIDVRVDGTLTPPKNISRDGYAVEGWYKEAECLNLANLSAPKNGDIYYAKWVALPTSIVATISRTVYVGDAVSKSDISVSVTYADGEVKTLTAEEFSADLQNVTATAGEKSVPVSYKEGSKEVSCSLAINVQASTLVSISVQYLGGTVWVGDTLSNSDFAVTGTFSNQTQGAVTAFTLSGFSSDVAGDKIVTVTATDNPDVSKTVILTVVSPAVTGISATYNGTVFVGDELDASKITVTATLENGRQKTISNYITSVFSSATAGEKSVSVTYGGNASITTVMQVTVCEPLVVSVSATYNGNVATGGSLDLSKITLTALYENGSTRPVTEFSVLEFSADEPGDATFTVVCTVDGKELSAPCTVNVISANLISVSAVYNGGNVYVGDKLNLGAITVTASYDLLPQAEVTNFWTEGFSSAEPGEKHIKVCYNYNDVTKFDYITVTVLKVELVRVTAQPQREILLFIGDQVPASDLTVTAFYNNGTSKNVTEFSCSVDSSTLGPKTATVSFTDGGVTKTAEFSVTVVKVVLESISAQPKQDIHLYVGDDLDPNDVTVTAFYNNGTSKTVNNFTCQVDSTEIGTHDATVTYTEDGVTKTAQYSVQIWQHVQVLTLVSLEAAPASEYVLYGEPLTNDDLVVLATYNSGETAPVTDFTFSGFVPTQSGEQTVTVSFTCQETKTATCTVNVYAPLQALSAQYNGENLTVGDQPAFEDIAVSVTYADGTSRTVTNFNVGNFSSAEAGTVVAQISFTELNPVTGEYDVVSDAVEITVVDAAVVTSSNLSIHFLELGHMVTNGNRTTRVGSYKTGDSVYIKAGDVDILIDAGSENASAPVLIDYIDRYVTDNKLEYVIATHGHTDHIGAFYSADNREGIFAHYQTDIIIDFATCTKTNPSATSVVGRYYAARDAEVAQGAVHYTAAQCFNETDGAKRVYQLTDDISLEILYNYYYFNTPSTDNDASVCVMIHQGDNHYLFTGDLENGSYGTSSSGAEQKMVDYYKNRNTPLPHCVLYKAGHHGSKTSTSSALMAAITPEYCCICTCGGSSEYTTANENQFPTQAFVDRIAPYTDRVYITSYVPNFSSGVIQSMNGDIVFSCVNGVVSVDCSNNNTKLKDTAWFKSNRTCPVYWQDGTQTPSMYHD